jgi:hypothetical protein
MIKTGSRVKWKWSTGYAHGEVKEIYQESVTKIINGHQTIRKGSKENRALWIMQDNGTPILKLESEVNHYPM